jgi:hypothetical protein
MRKWFGLPRHLIAERREAFREIVACRSRGNLKPE